MGYDDYITDIVFRGSYYSKILSVEAIPPNYRGQPDYVPFDSVFLQRYDLTIKELDRLGWKLTYPPDERMSDMMMYPPYQ